jgi:hypothetical protein
LEDISVIALRRRPCSAVHLSAAAQRDSLPTLRDLRAGARAFAMRRIPHESAMLSISTRNSGMRKSRHAEHVRSLAFSLLPLAAAAMLASTPALATEPADAPVSNAMRFALQRDLGVMPGQVPQYLEAERNAARKQHEARAALGDSFAGAWLERNRLGEFELVVATTQQHRVAAA